MKLPSFRRLFKGDYPEKEQGLVDRLSVSLNNGIDVLYNALNNNLSLADNVLCTVKDIQLKVDSSGNPAATSGFSVGFSGKALGVIVLRAVNQTNNSIYPTAAPFVSFSQTSSLITINNITGLQTGSTWLLTVVAFGT